MFSFPVVPIVQGCCLPSSYRCKWLVRWHIRLAEVPRLELSCVLPRHYHNLNKPSIPGIFHAFIITAGWPWGTRAVWYSGHPRVLVYWICRQAALLRRGHKDFLQRVSQSTENLRTSILTGYWISTLYLNWLIIILFISLTCEFEFTENIRIKANVMKINNDK